MKYWGFALAAVLLYAAVVRLAYLGEVPAGINNDEVSHGYNAYSIVTSGRDEWGKPWPKTSFAAFGDYKPPVYIYLTALAVNFSGLSPFSTRLVSALGGITAVLLAFLLVKKLYTNIALALLSASMLAISPFHIFVSRKAAENNLAVSFAIGATYAFIRAQESTVWLFVSMALFLVMAFTHTPARGFALLLVCSLLVLYRKLLLRHNRWQTILALSLFFLPVLSMFGSWEGRARLYQTTEYVTRGLYARLDETRAACQTYTLSFLCQIAFNRPTVRAWDVLENYVSHFSARALFVVGIRKFDAGDLRELDTYAMSGHGLFYLFGLPLFLYGLYWFVRPITKEKGVVIAWLLLSPIPDSLTSPGHAGRMTTMIPSVEIIASVGLWQVLARIKRLRHLIMRAVLYTTVFVVIGVSVVRFFIAYRHYSDYASRAFKYGYGELFGYVKTVEDRYSRIWVTDFYGEPYIYLLYFAQYSPKLLHESGHADRAWVADDQAGVWSRVTRVGKYHFVGSIDASKIEKNDLVINGPVGGPRDGNLLKVIVDKRGDPVFYVYEQKQIEQ